MFVLDVIPLTKIPLPFPQVLSYFSREPLRKRGLIRVQVGKRSAAAIVENCFPVEEKKMEIKKGPFALKGVQKIISRNEIITKQQFQLAKWMGQYYLVPLGLVFKLFLPPGFEKRKRQIKESLLGPPGPAPAKIQKEAEKRVVLLWQKERKQLYRKEIEKILSQRKQVLFLVPEVQFLRRIEKELKSFVAEKRTTLFRSGLKSSEELRIWKETARQTKKIIFGTRSALFLPFQNLGLIIIDQEENSVYESWGKEPRYDVRTVAMKLAETFGAKVILGTELPTVESYGKWGQPYFSSRNRHIKESRRRRKIELTPFSPDIQTVDMREEIKKGNFSVFSEELTRALKETFAKGKQAILFINRRGMATALFCQECGKVIKCKNCGVPLAYHLVGGKPILFCHHCGHQEKVPSVCPNCGGWRLKQTGKGTQKVFTELKEIFPEINVARLDSDIAPTSEEQQKIIDDFISKKTDVLIATQLLLKFSLKIYKLQAKNLILGVVLIDPLLNLPEFRSRERAFQLLTKLQSFGEKMIIQTYNPGLSVFQCLKERKAEEFFIEELKQRKLFFYPPFSEIIRLTFSHKDPQKAQREAQIVKGKLSKSLAKFSFDPEGLRTEGQVPRLPSSSPKTKGGQAGSKFQVLGPAPGFIPKIRGRYVWQIVIKVKSYGPRPLETGKKVKRKILNILSPQWKVEVNPESLL